MQLRKRLPASLRKFLAEYHAKLGSVVTDDPRYELRLRVLQELAPKDPDALAIQFTRYDDLTDEERDTVEQLGRKGHVIIRERLRNVAGADELSPKQVVAAVQARVPYPLHHRRLPARLEDTPGASSDRGAGSRAHRRKILHLLHPAQGLRLSPGVRRKARTGVQEDE
jgi:hypothetical protein